MSAATKGRAWARLALFSGSFLGTLLLFELIGTWVLGSGFVRGRLLGEWKVAARYDAELGWACLPGASAFLSNGDIHYSVRINEQGFRDPERSVRKPPGVRRVLMLGDSVTWGWGVDDGLRFSDLLDERLGPSIEVLNQAVPGYSTDQQLLSLLRDGFDYEPDVVFLGVVSNDVMEAESTEVYAMPKPRYVRAEGGAWGIENQPVAPPVPLWQLSLRRRWRGLVANSAFLSWITGVRPPEGEIDLESKQRFREPSPQILSMIRAAGDKIAGEETVTNMLLGRIAEECARRGVPLIAAVIPHKHDQYLYEPNFPRPSIDTPGEFKTYLTESLFRVAERHGFEALSVDSAMLSAVDAGRRLQCGDGHLNRDGNEVVADALQDVLLRLLEE